jgi:two-component system, NtrC family, sensor kinase
MNKISSLIIFVLVFLCIESSSAQNPKIAQYDSLIAIAPTDTGRINLILKKLDVLSTINLDSAINLALTTLGDAQRISFYRGEMDLRTSLFTNYSFKGNFKSAAEQLRELENTIKPSKDSIEFAVLYSNKGMFYGMQSKYDSSIFFYEKALRINEQVGNKNRIALINSNIAIAYQQQSNFPMALQYQQKSLQTYEELEDSEIGQAYTLVNMAITHFMTGDHIRAESTFLRSIELAKKVQLQNVELYAYSNLAGLYADENKWQSSYEYAMKAAELGGNMGDQGIEGASLSKASQALVNLNQPEKAIALSKEAITLAELSTLPMNINQAYSSMGYALMAQKHWKEAIPYYEKGFENLQNSDIYTAHIGMVTKQLSECYENTGNYAKALELFKQSKSIDDSVRQKENIRKATELTMNYEFEKKMTTAQAIQEAKDEIMYTRQVALIIGLILSLILILGALAAYFGKKKANVLLSNQKQEIEQTLRKLKNTQAQLIQSEKMASLGELTSGIAHEIQNPLNFMNNFSEVSAEMVEEIEEERAKSQDTRDETLVSEILGDIKQNLKKINHHGKRADAIVKGMLEHSKTGSGEKELTDLNALVKEYLKITYQGFKVKNKDVDIKLISDYDLSLPKVEIVRPEIGKLLLNILNNAFYAVGTHTLSLQPMVSVSTKLREGSPSGAGGSERKWVQISISDNGPGIPDAIKDKIFQPFFTTKPTGQGTGLGLSLSYDIVKAHGGDLKVETKEGEGSTFTISLK